MKTTFGIIGLIFTVLAASGQVLLYDAVIQGASFSTGGTNEGGGGGASCSSSPGVDYTGTGDSIYIGRATNNYYTGAFWTADQPTRTICSIQVDSYSATGDCSAKHYVCKIWTLSGETLVATIANGTSAEVTGWPASGAVTFTFSAYPVLSANTAYAITFSLAEDAAYDGNNFAAVALTTAAVGHCGVWNQSLAVEFDPATENTSMRFYFYE